MVVSKIYNINYRNIDSAILEIADDIRLRNYTIRAFEMKPTEISYHTKLTEPCISITLYNRKADA